jgi:membrane protein DedA with SNARE-associated domain
MDFENLVAVTTAFVRDHQAWAGPIVAVLAFCESLAFVSLLVPATVILIAIGALLGGSGFGLASATFWIVCLSGAIGAVAGDWLSYEVGRRFDRGIKNVWPLNRSPRLVDGAEAFVARWGVWGVFFGRFSGPLRALVPIVAGIFDMPRLRFQVANVASGGIWSFGLLAPGAGLLDWFGWS